jgi:DNA polymerase III delta subunit
MIYLIYGNDKQKVIAKSGDLVMALREKKPDAVFTRLNAEQFSAELVRELCAARGLFEAKQIVHLAWVGERKEQKEILLDTAGDMAKSEHIFIISEGVLDAKSKKALEAKAEKVQVYSSEKEKTAEFPIFSLADAFSRKDKKSMWVLYTKAKRAGVEDEQMHGIVLWQIKALILAKKTKTPQEAGLNPYVFSKASAAAKQWTDDELQNTYFRAVSMYHNARRGLFSFEHGFERYLLE